MNIWLRLLISATTLAVILATAPLYSEALFEASLTYIPNIQKNSTPAQQFLWRAWSDGGLTVAIALPIVATFALPTQRTRCFYYVCALSLVFTVMNFTKLGYHQARPYWADTSPPVAAYSCSTDFGNPSGHSETVAGMFGTLALDYSFTQPVPLPAKALGLVTAGIFSLSIAYSRLFLGVHSLNQVIFGLSLGVWIAGTMEFCARHAIFQHVGALTAGTPPRSSSALAVRSVFALALILTLAISQYAVLSQRIVVEQEWLDNIAQKCDAGALDFAFAHKSLVAVSTDVLAFGAYWGVLLQNRRYSGMACYGQPPGLGRVLLRLLLQATVSILVLLLALVSPTQIANVYMQMLLKSLLPLALAMVILFGFSDELGLRATLYTEAPRQLDTQVNSEQPEFSLSQSDPSHHSGDESNSTKLLQVQSAKLGQRQRHTERSFNDLV